METVIKHIEPKIGEGIYLIKDVSKILNLEHSKVYRWISGYWNGGLNEDVDYTFGDTGNKAINFYSLIEFYTFFKLREAGLSTSEIRRFHQELSEKLNTKYPFAIAQDYYVENRNKGKRKSFVYYKYLDSLIKFDKKNQFSFSFLDTFLDKIEFDKDNFAIRFFPLDNNKNVVVDPKRQFGQPIVAGTNIKTFTLASLYNGGESLENISTLYNIGVDKVQDAIKFQNAA